MKRFFHIVVVLLTTSAVTMFALNIAVFHKEKYTYLAAFMVLAVLLCLSILEMGWGEVSNFFQHVFLSKKTATRHRMAGTRSPTKQWDWGWFTKTFSTLSAVIAKNPWAGVGLFAIIIAFLWWLFIGIPLKVLIMLTLIAIIACITHANGWGYVIKNWKEIWALVSALIFIGSALTLYLYGLHTDVVMWLAIGFLSGLAAFITMEGKWGSVATSVVEAFFGTKHRACLSFGIIFTTFGLYMMQHSSEKSIGFLLGLAGFLLIIGWFFYLIKPTKTGS